MMTARRRNRSTAKARKARRRALNKKDRRPRATIVAPEVFSLILEPQEVVRFLNDVRSAARKHHLYIDMRDVRHIDPEAVAAFVAVIESMAETRVGGNQPLDSRCRARLHDFGFFERVRGVPSESRPTGAIRTERRGTSVESPVAKQIVKFGMEQLRRDMLKHGPSQNVFLETMSNTFCHARGQKAQRQPWWAAAYYDGQEDKVCFTAVDCGIGILENPSLKQRFAFFRSLDLSAGAKLRSLLEGKVPSRTGEPHRGRGLPSVYDNYKMRRINNLMVLSNAGYALPALSVFRDLRVGFSGTIVYWEVSNRD